jgi:hypothetical protein
MSAPQHEHPPPPTLDYLNPRASTPRLAFRPLVGGFILAIAITTFSGCIVFAALGGGIDGPAPSTSYPTIFGYLALGIASLGGGIVMLVRAQARGWFVIGALLGLGVMGLIEGMCFANP